MNEQGFMSEALRLAREGIARHHGGPFGAVLVVDNQIVGRGWNQVVLRNDPTAHAEILAIREACQQLGRFHLTGASLFTSCEPCPMCLSASYWARIDRILYAATTLDVQGIGFDDQRIRDALSGCGPAIPMQQLLREASLEILQAWRDDTASISY